MSQYNAAVSRQQQCLNVVRQNLPTLQREQDALLAGLSSANLTSLTAEVFSASSAEELLGLAAQAQTLPGLDLLTAPVSAEIGAVAASLPNSVDAGTLATAQSTLGAALGQAAETMASVERLTTVETVAAVLPGLGYHVVRSDAQHATAFEASKGHETMLVVVTDGAAVQTDHVGLADVTCQVRQNEFVQAMADAGALLSEQAHVEHHDPRGGSLAAAAAREGTASLAQGAAALADRQFSQSAVGQLFESHVTASARPTLFQ